MPWRERRLKLKSFLSEERYLLFHSDLWPDRDVQKSNPNCMFLRFLNGQQCLCKLTSDACFYVLIDLPTTRGRFMTSPLYNVNTLNQINVHTVCLTCLQHLFFDLFTWWVNCQRRHWRQTLMGCNCRVPPFIFNDVRVITTEPSKPAV